MMLWFIVMVLYFIQLSCVIVVDFPCIPLVLPKTSLQQVMCKCLYVCFDMSVYSLCVLCKSLSWSWLLVFAPLFTDWLGLIAFILNIDNIFIESNQTAGKRLVPASDRDSDLPLNLLSLKTKWSSSRFRRTLSRNLERISRPEALSGPRLTSVIP